MDLEASSELSITKSPSIIHLITYINVRDRVLSWYEHRSCSTLWLLLLLEDVVAQSCGTMHSQVRLALLQSSPKSQKLNIKQLGRETNNLQSSPCCEDAIDSSTWESPQIRTMSFKTPLCQSNESTELCNSQTASIVGPPWVLYSSRYDSELQLGTSMFYRLKSQVRGEDRYRQWVNNLWWTVPKICPKNPTANSQQKTPGTFRLRWIILFPWASRS